MVALAELDFEDELELMLGLGAEDVLGLFGVISPALVTEGAELLAALNVFCWLELSVLGAEVCDFVMVLGIDPPLLSDDPPPPPQALNCNVINTPIKVMIFGVLMQVMRYYLLR